MDWVGLGYGPGLPEAEKQALWEKWSGVDWVAGDGITIHDAGWGGRHPEARDTANALGRRDESGSLIVPFGEVDDSE